MSIGKYCYYFVLLLSLVKSQALSSDSLAEEATLVVTRIEMLEFEDDLSITTYNAHGSSNSFYIKPTYQFPTAEKIGYDQLVRIKSPLFVTYPKSKTTFASYSTGDTQIFDLLVLKDNNVFRLGLGFVAIIPTATKVQAGQGKWQLGPAFGFSYTGIPRWQFSLLAQNPNSFAGISKLPKQRTVLFKPAIVWHFTRNWYVTSDAEWTLYWSRRQYQIPVNFGIGRIVKLLPSEQKVNISAKAEWMAYHHTPQVVPKFTAQISLAFLFP